MAARRIAKQILGTIVAVLAGWFAAMLFLEATTFIELLHQPHNVVPDALWVAPITVSIVMAYFVIPVWLIVLIPLYLFVPSSSIFWRSSVCSTSGVLAGLVIIAFWLRGIPGVGGLAPEAWFFYVIAAIVGGVACLTAALTRRKFKETV